MNPRSASRQRETAETSVSVDLVLDGSGSGDINTGIPFFDHMLVLLAKHSLFDLTIKARGDLAVDFHHTVEDTGIVLGEALAAALSGKTGIRRYGWARIPMDETLAQVAIDLSGRPFLEFRVPSEIGPIGAFDFGLVEEFSRALAMSSAMTLHVEVEYGKNNHHIAEAIFKALARALDMACQIDPRVTGIPSSKGKL
ncbi:MAG: imidazoleglycerol-phosphate dehydratase HisB [Verrucomicrobia bacterium]|nr:imidazoleglycerol-phosphate dehydratase HisB [Verrucomicrobiota bacterium]MBV8279919.1 imidazoleglycerol-phosphate dehydratase HisB [Verrucomicrobiota bacterium]